jgi:HEAT repeat protein
MSTLKLNLAWCAALSSIGLLNAFAQKPTPLLTAPAEQLVAVIQSNASQKEKVDACRQLAVIGNRDAVPALAALLGDEQLSHSARYALERIPDPAVDQAFRAALSTVKDRRLVGVIGSIGVRRDAKAVGQLTAFLSDANADVVQAAARALGNIADPAAVNALRRALPSASPANELSVCEGLLRCAESLEGRGQREDAVALYDELRARPGPQQVRVAGIRGAILSRGNTGLALLRDELLSTDYVSFAAAVRTGYELPGPEVSKTLAAALPRLSEDRQLLVVQALGRRGDSSAEAALASESKAGNPPVVRLAALRGLGEIGRTSAASTLEPALTDTDREIAQTAFESFASLRGNAVDARVAAMFKSQDAKVRRVAVELTGRRKLAALLPQLETAALDSDPEVRPPALTTLGELSGPVELPRLLGLLPKLLVQDDLDALEQALTLVCGKAEHLRDFAGQLSRAMNGAQASQKGVVLRTLSSLGGPESLNAVRAAVDDSNPEVHGAAIRALGAWKSGEAAPELLTLAKNSSSATDQTLCLRSYLGLAANPEIPAEQRLALCREAIGVVKTADEKKLLLSALGSVDSVESAVLIAPGLEESSTKEEACAALLAVAEKVLQAPSAGQVSSRLVGPLEKAAQVTSNAELAKRAKVLLEQARSKAGKT